MYIRSLDEAVRAVAGILDLPDRRTRIVQSTVKIMLCLDAEPRAFLADAQALLLEDGLDALRRRREEALEAQDAVPLIVLDAEGDRLFEDASRGLDALRLAEVVRQILPDFRPERWMAARALLDREADVRAACTDAIQARGDAVLVRRARASLDALVASRMPAWRDRAGTLRAACFDVLRGAELADPDELHSRTDRLFELFAISDERAQGLLDALDQDPAQAVRQVARLHEAMDAALELFRSTPEGRREAA